MHYYLKLCVFSVIIIHVNLQKEETNRVIVYNSFEEYKNSLNKTYAREFEEVRSRRAYEENCKTIEEHNELFKKGKTKFILRANCFADLTSQQYLRKHVRLERSLRPEKEPEPTASSVTHLGSVELPQSLDWRDKGFITPPDNQRSCGSCYAYSICQSIEGQVYKRTGELISLSEQQIVDCSKVIGNHGCGGGSLRGTLEYLEKYGGLMRRQDYPYMAKEGKCQFVPALSIVNVTAWAILPSDNEDAIQVALATIGPVAVSINASPKTFQLYSEGIYDDENCPSDKVNHAMLAIGYTPDFWILKNWWGKDWGDDGYMKIRRNKNLCGIATYAAYAIV